MLRWLLVANLLSSTADPTSVPLYLELDGTYYSVLPGGTIEYIGDAWVVTETTMASCNRRNNDVQQYSSFGLFYGPNLDIVYLNPTAGSSYACYGGAQLEYCALTMTSTTDDIVCDGVVAAPDPIFGNGFEP